MATDTSAERAQHQLDCARLCGEHDALARRDFNPSKFSIETLQASYELGFDFTRVLPVAA